MSETIRPGEPSSFHSSSRVKANSLSKRETRSQILSFDGFWNDWQSLDTAVLIDFSDFRSEKEMNICLRFCSKRPEIATHKYSLIILLASSETSPGSFFEALMRFAILSKSDLISYSTAINQNSLAPGENVILRSHHLLCYWK